MILSEQKQVARYNIGRNAVPNAFVADGIEGVGLHPKIVVVR
jgi:hypothetical protein